MTRKRAIKLLIPVNRGGERTAVQDVMRNPRFSGRTNAERVDEILVYFAFFAAMSGAYYSAFRAMELHDRLRRGEVK